MTLAKDIIFIYARSALTQKGTIFIIIMYEYVLVSQQFYKVSIITAPGSRMHSNGQRCLVTCGDHFGPTVAFVKVWNVLFGNARPGHHPEL